MKLHLADYNKVDYDNIIIRRSVIGRNLEIIATLPKGTLEYDDTTAPLDVLLNYTTCARRGTTDFQPSSYWAIRRTDNGPKVNDNLYMDALIRGDARHGLYGWIPGDVDFDIARLQILYPEANLEKIDTEGKQSYAKVEYEGRLVFVPNIPNAISSFNEMATAGLMRPDGSLDDLIGIPQGKVAQMGLYAYRPFLMTREEYGSLYGNLFASTALGQTNSQILGNTFPNDHLTLVSASPAFYGENAYVFDLHSGAELKNKNDRVPMLVCWEYIPYSISMVPISIIFSSNTTQMIGPGSDLEIE